MNPISKTFLKRTASGMFMLLCILFLTSCGGGGGGGGGNKDDDKDKNKGNEKTIINLWEYIIPAQTGTITYHDYFVDYWFGEAEFFRTFEDTWETITASTAFSSSVVANNGTAEIDGNYIEFWNEDDCFYDDFYDMDSCYYYHDSVRLKVEVGKTYFSYRVAGNVWRLYDDDFGWIDIPQSEYENESEYAFFGPYSSKTFSIPYTYQSRTDNNVIIKVASVHYTNYEIIGDVEDEGHSVVVTYYAKGKGIIGKYWYWDCYGGVTISPDEDYTAVCDFDGFYEAAIAIN